MDKLGILICENLGREVTAVVEAEGFGDVTVGTFAARCVLPPFTWAELEPAIRGQAGTCSHLCVLGGGCMAGLAAVPPALTGHVTRLAGCFELLAGKSLLAGYQQAGAYLLTPGWLARWRQHLAEWGFDQATARAFFAESVSRLVLLDSAVDAAIGKLLAEFADFVGRPYEIVPVGLDFARLALTKIVLDWRLARERGQVATTRTDAEQKMADYAMVFDLIGSLTGLTSENQVVEDIFDLFAMLFRPDRLTYLPIREGQPEQPIVCAEPPMVNADWQDWLARFDQEYAWTEAGNGFVLRLSYQGQRLAVLAVEDLALPEYKQHYLNLALTIIQVCSLAIANARLYEETQRYAVELEARVAERTAELQASHRALEDAAQRLQALEHLKNQFLTNASHELRTPVTNIVSYLHLLEHGKPEKRERYLTVLRNESALMQGLLEDLLEVSHLDLGKAQPALAPVDINELVVALSQSRIALVADRNLTLTIQADPALPLAPADSRLLRQAVKNMLMDVADHTTYGETITLCTQTRQEGGQTWAALWVGRGTAIWTPEEWARQFASVEVDANSQMELTAGANLRQAISREIIRRHGGKWVAGSQTGQGDLFAVWLPVPPEGVR